MSTKILIHPGLGNSDEFHWQTLWESMFPFAKRINQHSWIQPNCDNWVKCMNKEIARHDGSRIFIVAHSLGCHALAHWSQQSSRRIAGALLVAPPDVDLLEQKQLAFGFSPLPQMTLPFKSIVVASANDPYASLETTKEYANIWGSWFMNIGNKGHVNSQSNLGFWPEGLKILHTLTNNKQILSYA